MADTYTQRGAAKELGISKTAALNRALVSGYSWPITQSQLESIRVWRGVGRPKGIASQKKAVKSRKNAVGK
jgi:hypothetical protein